MSARTQHPLKLVQKQLLAAVADVPVIVEPVVVALAQVRGCCLARGTILRHIQVKFAEHFQLVHCRRLRLL